MRLSTSQVFTSNVSGYQKGYSEIVKTQQQLSSGVRIQTPADDPVGAARLLQLEQQSSELGQYSTNLTTATNSLTQEEGVLTSVTNVLQRARELAVRAGNGSLSDNDRTSISSELEQIQTQLMNLMNSKDSSGQYLFSGSNSGTQPYVQNPNGTYSYQGDQGSLGLQVASSTRMSINDSGWSVFENVTNASRTYADAPTRDYTDPDTGVAVTGAVSADDQRVFLSQGLVESDSKYNSSFRAGSPYTLELVSSTQFKITDSSGADVTSEASSTNGSFDPTAIDGNTVTFRGVSLELDVALKDGDNSADSSLDNLLTGYSFDFGMAPDEFAVTRSATNTSGAQMTASVANQNNYTTQFPANGVIVQFSSATGYSVYSQPMKTGDAAISTGTLGATFPQTISVGGVDMTISAAPASGDQFTLQPKSQETQSILETISNLTAALKTPTSGDTSAQLALRDAVASAITNLDKGSNQVLATQASIGARLNTVDVLSTENETLSITNASTQSDIRDTDMAAATTQLVLQQTMLEAAQASFIKISQLSLFDKM